MLLIKLKEKGQVTIPAAVREQVAAHKGDLFEVTVDKGNIILKPQEMVSRTLPRTTKPGKGVDISSWIGAASGLFKSPEDVENYIRAERSQWD